MHAAGVQGAQGQTLRPTAARVKEALFKFLPHDLSGTKVLDLLPELEM
jgi:16S rRNA G966 N2-methylase RsmD